MILNIKFVVKKWPQYKLIFFSALESFWKHMLKPVISRCEANFNYSIESVFLDIRSLINTYMHMYTIADSRSFSHSLFFLYLSGSLSIYLLLFMWWTFFISLGFPLYLCVLMCLFNCPCHYSSVIYSQLLSTSLSFLYFLC